MLLFCLMCGSCKEQYVHIRDKMFWLLGVLFLIGAYADENCDHLGVLIYKDMDCKPNSVGKSCPSKYICDNLSKPKDKCYYRQKALKSGEFATDISNCDAGCRCSTSSNSSRFGCAILECGNWGLPPPDGCYYTYSFDACCASGTACPKGTAEPYKCTYNGQEYREGEMIFPEDSCTRCLCQKGFKGKIEEPFCRKRECGVQLKFQENVQNKCAPIYRDRGDGSKILCCPDNFLCPDGTEKITGTATSDDVCEYGDKTIKVGQGFEREYRDVVVTRKASCRCNIPPLLSCTSKY